MSNSFLKEQCILLKETIFDIITVDAQIKKMVYESFIDLNC